MSKPKRSPTQPPTAIDVPWTDPDTGFVGGTKPTSIEEERVQRAFAQENARTPGPHALKLLAAYRRGIVGRSEFGRSLITDGLNR